MSAAARTLPVGLSNGYLRPEVRMHRFSVSQYHRMIQAGVLGEDDNVELLEGWIVAKMARNPPHDVCLSLAQTLIADLLPEDWHIRIQSAITLPRSEPEPDIAVVRGPPRRYAKAHPKPKAIAMLVEVAEASLEDDRLVKGPIYAQSRIPVYWIINLVDRQVEVHTSPRVTRTATFWKRAIYGAGELVPVVIGRRVLGSIAVNDVLP